MADNIPFASGGDSFVDKTITAHQQIATSSSGTILSLTPPAGKRVRLEYLQRFTNGSEANIDIVVGGNNIITGGSLGDSSATPIVGNFYIGQRNNSTGAPIASTSAIVGGIDEVIEVNKTAGSTGSTILYSYKFGE